MKNQLVTRIPGYIQIPQIPDSHYCPDTRIHLPGNPDTIHQPAIVSQVVGCLSWEGWAAALQILAVEGLAGAPARVQWSRVGGMEPPTSERSRHLQSGASVAF